MTGQRFSNAWNKNKNKPVFADGLCVSGHPQHPAGLSLASPFTSCLRRAAGQLGSGRGESVGPSQVFPEHAHGPRHVSSILDFEQFVGAFPKHLIPQPLLPSFLLSLFFAPTIMFIHCLSKHFRVSDFHKLPGWPL